HTGSSGRSTLNLPALPYEVRCPLHGSIAFTELERKIIDHPYLQRLRAISQLGFAERVFPGATHTRFSHSLGVMHLAGRIFEQVLSTAWQLLAQSFTAKELVYIWKIIRLAGLLHDLGHPPFSHSFEPLLPPQYSFDLASPKVGMGILQAADVLELAFPDPLVRIPGSVLGLISPLDDLDALSGSNAGLPAGASFVLLFSVGRATVGTVDPDQTLVAAGVPYSASDQATKGQAAGDQYVALDPFQFTGRSVRRLPPVENNSLVRNNFDEGGTDFAADPPTSASQTASRVPQDNVNATAGSATSPFGGTGAGLYFSASSQSPSLSDLPGGNQPSGAHIFFFGNAPKITTLYAAFHDLGLVRQDDINAMIVRDQDDDGQFNNNDVVLFSLAPGSPSLKTFPDASSDGAAADVFATRPGLGVVLVASARTLGLGAPADNVDALDLIPETDPIAFALNHGIRAVRGDWNDDGNVALDDFGAWDGCMLGPVLDMPPECAVFDFDTDNHVDLVDFGGFQRALTTGN
ncbi:MAG: HD domain-containing protein, partial [Planctomycetes bacterium]|nr:HD domain-containing protein [Planctomycetota bacterium]